VWFQRRAGTLYAIALLDLAIAKCRSAIAGRPMAIEARSDALVLLHGAIALPRYALVHR